MIVAVLAWLASCSAPVVAPTPASGELVAFGGGPGGARDACFTCHGLSGEGDGLAPRLAGQSSGYLLKQLDDYGRKRRKHAAMEGIAVRLGDADKLAVARYYASVASPREVWPSRMPPGAWTLYLDGDEARGLAPCAKCHGARGEGRGPANPALRGQPAAYVANQLMLWKAAKRRNDPEHVMGAISQKLSQAEIEALSAYVAAMSP
jgi:cytochrome c553